MAARMKADEANALAASLTATETPRQRAAKLEASIFDDDSLVFGEQAGRTYNLTFEINGVTFYCKTLAPQVLAGIGARYAEWEKRMAKADGLATVEAPFDEAAFAREQMGIVQDAIDASLQDWESKAWHGVEVEVSPENIARMARPVKLQIFNIVRASSMQGEVASAVLE